MNETQHVLTGKQAVCTHPVFIIGSPRSGTTILAESLAQHSGFWTSEESEILFDLFGEGKLARAFERAMQRPNPTWLRAQKIGRGEFMKHLGLGVNMLFTKKSQGRRWIEQTPHYALMIEELSQMFPGAFFLHILRDGRRVVHSMVNIRRTYSSQGIAEKKKAGRIPRWPEDFKAACVSWRQCVETAAEFCRKHPNRGLTITNENLVGDPKGGFCKILQFIKAPHEEAPVQYFRSHRVNSSFPEQGARPPGKTPWTEWNPEQRRIFSREAGPTMVKLGLAKAEEFEPTAQSSVAVSAGQRSPEASVPGKPAPPPPAAAARNSDSRVRSGGMEASPIVICGAPRSGTTYLTELINRHPEISVSNEQRIFAWMHESLNVLTRQDRFVLGDREDFIEYLRRAYPDLIRGYYQRKRPGVRYWGDKNPHYAAGQNQGCLESVWKLFPQARLILILRDGRDVVCSLLRKRHPDGSPWVDFEGAHHAWTGHMDAGCSFGRSLPSSQYFELRYEDLIRDDLAMARRIFSFLGMDVHPQVEEFCRAQQRERIPFSGPTRDLRRDLTRSLWHSSLDPGQQLKSLALIGRHLVRYGYETEESLRTLQERIARRAREATSELRPAKPKPPKWDSISPTP